MTVAAAAENKDLKVFISQDSEESSSSPAPEQHNQIILGELFHRRSWASSEVWLISGLNYSTEQHRLEREAYYFRVKKSDPDTHKAVKPV